MCGIVGYCGNRAASEVLIEGLKRLEYRGYDSAGICVGENSGLKVIKSVGKLANLISLLPSENFGKNGIAHTRWATHGGVSFENSHPHTDCSGKIAIVHNGIIENYIDLKERLIKKGHKFKSETDSEVIAHLIEDAFDGDLTEAVKSILPLLKGTYGLIAMHSDLPDVLVGARNGSPLVLGVGNDEMFFASDVSAIVFYTKQVVYINDGEIVTIKPGDFSITDSHNHKLQKSIDVLSDEFANDGFDKMGFPHFMLKEIFEQPESIKRGMLGRLNIQNATGHLGGLNMTDDELLKIQRIVLVGSGTSYFAGCVASYLLESIAQLPCKVELSSELSYKDIIVEKNTLYFVISQSGETADTLFALRELKRKGARVLGICNAVGSTIARESVGGVYIHSGPEIAVASTKAFSSQLTALTIFTLIMARIRNFSYSEGLDFIEAFKSIPTLIEKVLLSDDSIKKVAERYYKYTDFLFLGRGLNYPLAMEGALKLKEISYIHAEGLSAGEIKHGSIALVNENMPCLFLVPKDYLYDKVISNMKEVKARNGKIIAVATEGDEEVAKIADDVIYVPNIKDCFYPFLLAIPLQLFAYHCAVLLVRDVDQPRNLAKSVTVE